MEADKAKVDERYRRAFIVPFVPVGEEAKPRLSSFSGQVIVKQSDGRAFPLKRVQNTSWKKAQDELLEFRSTLDEIHHSVQNLASSLVAAQSRKSIQEKVLSESPIVMVYAQPRRIELTNSLSEVRMQVCGFKSMHTALNGDEPGFIKLGAASDGDNMVVRRGVHTLSRALVLSTGVILRRERTYAAGGGGGYSGGGGGGYGGGGGGGGGCYVSSKAQIVSMSSGMKVKKGMVQIVGNVSHGLVTIKEPIFSEKWEFSFSGKYEEWIAPRRSMFVIEAKGAAASAAGNHSGGTGAVVEGYFSLEKDDKIIMLIGGMSDVYTDEWGACSGGGGGTFVFLNNTTPADVMLIAGGGGGAAFCMYSNGSDGQHASTDQSGTNGTGLFSGSGGREGGSGYSRLISTCFIDGKADSPFAAQHKLKHLLERGMNSFFGAGSGLFEQACGAATGLHDCSKDVKNAEPNSGIANGGFGGGGCAELHPEEVLIRGIDTSALIVCKQGSPTISGLTLEHHGREIGSVDVPQCILVEGGELKLRGSLISCEIGIGINIVKSFVAIANSDFVGSAYLESGCKISNCGNHGLVVSSGNCVCKDITIVSSAKDGLHIFGKETTVVLESCVLISNNQHNIYITDGANLKANSCTIEKSSGSCCAVIGKGSTLNMTSCHIRHSDMSGAQFSEGARGELRTCQIYGHHDVGVLAQGNASLQKNKFAHPEDETKAQILHCNIKENGYGVWAQDGANISIVGGTISGSVHKDINQHIANGITTAGALLNVGGVELRMRSIFLAWKNIAEASATLCILPIGVSLSEAAEKLEKIINNMSKEESENVSHEYFVTALQSVGIALGEDELEKMLGFFDDRGDGVLSMCEVFEFFKDQAHKQKMKQKLSQQPSSRKLIDSDDFEHPSDGVMIVRNGYALFEDAISRGAKVAIRYDEEEHILLTPEKSFQTEQILLNQMEKLSFRDALEKSAFSAALSHVQKNDIILLKKGRHMSTETFHWSSGCVLVQPALRSASRAECVIVAPASSPIVQLTGGSMHFRGVQIEQDLSTTPTIAKTTGQKGGDTDFVFDRDGIALSYPLILVQDGYLYAESCSFGFWNVVALVVHLGKLKLQKCMIQGQTDSGIGMVARHGGTVEISECSFSKSGHACLAVHGGLLDVSNSIFLQSQSDAIVGGKGGVVTIANCKIIEAEGSGLFCKSEGMIKATECNIVRSRGCGVVCSGSKSRMDLLHCKIQESSVHGISCSEQAYLLVKATEVILNHGCGICCKDSGTRFRGYGVKVISNHADGIYGNSGAEITLETCQDDNSSMSQVRQNVGCGLFMDVSAKFQGFEVVIQQNGGCGVLANQQANINLCLSSIVSNQHSAIKVRGVGTKVSLSHCTCSDHQINADVEDGVLVTKRSLFDSKGFADVSNKRRDQKFEIILHYQKEDVMPFEMTKAHCSTNAVKGRKQRISEEDSPCSQGAQSSEAPFRLPSIWARGPTGSHRC